MEKVTLFIVAFVLILLSIGCSATSESLAFEESNAYFLRENIKNIDIEKITEHISESDNIVFVSTEEQDTYDSNINSTIEDVLIQKFINNGYSILERDNDLIYRLLSESDDNYTHYFKNKSIAHGQSGSLGLSGAFNPNIPAYSNSLYTSGGYGFAQENFDKMTIDTKLHNADKIISYRVLENGIVYENNYNKNTQSNDIKRTANTFISFRVTDTSSGKILSIIDLKQSSSDNITESDKNILEKYKYRNYPFSYPNINGNPKQMEVDTKHSSNKPTFGYKELVIIGGAAIVAIIATL